MQGEGDVARLCDVDLCGVDTGEGWEVANLDRRGDAPREEDFRGVLNTSN